jgi:hypothetical protein
MGNRQLARTDTETYRDLISKTQLPNSYSYICNLKLLPAGQQMLILCVFAGLAVILRDFFKKGA